MPETGEVAVGIFKTAKEFWEKDDHKGLSERAIANIGRVLEYTSTPEGEVALKSRAKQLDEAINHFNQINESGRFEGSDQKESKKLAEKILNPGEKLRLISEIPTDADSMIPYIEGFKRLAGKYPESQNNYYYTFLDKIDANTPEQYNSLITGLLVDGFAGFAFRARRIVEGRPRDIGRSDLTAVDSICEMVGPGELQTEMYKSNWYRSNFGLDPEFCAKIAKQFEER